jgi:predicted Zn-dependent peptidase
LIKKLLEKYLKKLIGRTDIEDALKKLDDLTKQEVQMVTAQVLETAQTVDGGVGRLEDKLDQMER